MALIIPATEVAWQAGIVDGEGCITLAKGLRKGRPSPAFRPMITVTNTDRRIMEPFPQWWTGKLYQRPDNRTDMKWADSYTWYCPRSYVVPFLSAILPYLRAKRKQAELLIEFTERCQSFPRVKGTSPGANRGGSLPLGEEEIEYRDGIWNKVRKLNTKGKFSRESSNG